MRGAWTLAVAAALGCSTATAPEGNLGAESPDAGSIAGPEIVPLDLDPVVPVTPWPTVPITGTGPAGGTVFYQVTGSPERTVDLGATGEFCVDVSLSAGGNQVTFSAVSASGAMSDAKIVTVRREGTPPTTPDGGQEIVDRTAGASYFGNADGTTVGGVSLEVGSYAMLVDGDTTNLVRFQGGYLNNEAIAYALSERMAVHAFQVTAPTTGGPDCGPEGFEVWVSDATQPALSFDGVAFTKVAEMNSSVAAGTTYDLDSSIVGVPARFVAVRMTDASCGYLDNVYGLRELRVLAEPAGGEIEEPVGGPTCASGGQ